MWDDVYTAPQVVESFDALEVFGTADGSEVLVAGNGSQLPVISITG